MIQIDMEMPKCCQECKFCNGFTLWNCTIKDKHINRIDIYSERPQWCPLKESVDLIVKYRNTKSSEELETERKAYEFQLQSEYNRGYNDGAAKAREDMRKRLGL